MPPVRASLLSLSLSLSLPPPTPAHLDGQYVASGGDFEASYFESKCGGLRVDCWRSGIKELLYQGQAIPDGTYFINISSVGLSSEALAL